LDKVELVTAERKILTRYENNFEVDFSKLENFDFLSVFLKCKANVVVSILLALLQERKVVLVGDCNRFNTQALETLMSLLYPLSWQC
jgi:DENN (AEX-3) domain